MQPGTPPPAGIESRPTAGLRGASWNETQVPNGMAGHIVPVQTADGAQITGCLYADGSEPTVILIMHPRELLLSHYLVPALRRAGYACWVQGPRTVGNDIRLEHEVALLDVAAGVQHLKGRGFERVVLLGNSGGASLFAFYNQQSKRAPVERLQRTPGGRPVKLAEAAMPVVDGFVFIAPHPGQGVLLMNCIDPSVVDEDDPLSVDPALDAFNPENGFRPKPQPSAYSPAFLERYRAAQKVRVQRIDERARALLKARMAARRRAKEAGDGALREDLMAAALNTVFTVWRTDADPRAFDLSLDPSARRWGTVWGGDPVASNLGAVGFGRVCTPESWLSTWSALSSNASFALCGGDIEQPALIIYYTGDNTVFPSDVAAIEASIASQDKQRFDIEGNHHGHPLKPGGVLPQEIAAECVCQWLAERF